MASGEPAQRAFEAWVRGRVQGVGFRWCTQRRAQELRLGGWVCNLADGRVHVWVEGAGPNAAEMEAWLRVGPRGSRVEELDLRERRPIGFGSFEIRRAEA